MMTAAKLASVIPSNVDLSSEEREAVLETALLAIASDGDVHRSEAAAFFAIADRIKTNGTALLERFQRRTRDGDPDKHLLDIASSLRTEAARALAYRVAYVLSLAYAEASDGEFEFDLQLIDALELPQAEADRIVAEVDGALKE